MKTLFVPPVFSALGVGVIGLLGYTVGMPWLFPSLGPTIAFQTSSPEEVSAEPWNVVMGHLIGLISGITSVLLFSATAEPAVVQGQPLTLPRIGAATLAVLLSMSLQKLFKAKHPPAEATTLLVALGAMSPTVKTVATAIVGVLLTAVMGSLFRRYHMRQLYRSSSTETVHDSPNLRHSTS